MTKMKQMALRVAGPLAMVLVGFGVMAAPASAGYLSGCTKPGVNLYAAADLAQGFGSMYCASNVSSMELEVNLWEDWTSDGEWHDMATRTIGPTSPGKGKQIGTESPATVPCKDSSKRNWKVVATGSADIGGVWWSDSSSLEEELSCRG